jgi:hypothetical protein
MDMTASHDSQVSRDFTSARVVAERQTDSLPAIDDGGAEWDHPHLPSQRVADSVVSHAASRRRAIASLDDDEEGL